MPRFHPHSRISSRAEQEFARILAALDDSWHVFPSVTFESLDKSGHIHARGEIDAVLYHADHGILVVEVKAGSWRCHDGRWEHRPRGTETWIPEKDPFEQANRGYLWLIEALREVSKGRPRPKVAWAVAVPDASRGECTVPEARRRLLLDRTICHDVEHSLLKVLALDSGKEHHPPVSADQEQDWFDVIRPPIEIFEAAEAVLDRTRLEIGLASREINLLARTLRAQKRLRVEGPPGSGKTVLALQWLEQANNAFRGYLCFNAPLATWIAETPQVRNGAVEARTFHDLGRLLIEAANPEAWPTKATSEFWSREFLPLLHQSIDKLESEGLLDRFDILAVDEAQDFAPEWWSILERLLAPDGSLGIFLDPLQDLRGVGGNPPATLGFHDPIRLDAVRRIPIPIQDWIMEQCGETWEAHPELQLDSGELAVLPWETPEVQKQVLQALLDRLLGQEAIPPERILICSLRAQDQCPWSRGLEPARWAANHGFSPRKHVRIETAMRAKGLEADVVIIPNLERTAPDYQDKLLPRLRVAASRSTGRLFVLEQA